MCQFDSQVSNNKTGKLQKKIRAAWCFPIVDLESTTKQNKNETIFDVI